MSLVTVSLDGAAVGILAGNAFPRIVGEVTIGEPDFATFFVDLLNANFDGLSFLQHVAWVIDSLPTELTDMNEPVYPAQVDERAKILQAANPVPSRIWPGASSSSSFSR